MKDDDVPHCQECGLPLRSPWDDPEDDVYCDCLSDEELELLELMEDRLRNDRSS